MVHVEARILGSGVDRGIGSVLLNPSEQSVTAVDLIRLAVHEQVRELTPRRRLSQADAILALRRQYQTSGSITALPDEPRINADREAERAVAAFSAGTCLLFVDGEQIRALEERIAVDTETKVQFLRLVPLVGG